MQQTTREIVTNVALVSLVLAAYAVLAVRRLGLRRGDVLERLRALTAHTEPAIFLDSARVVVLLSWTQLLPRLDLLARSLEHASELAVPKGIFRYVDVGLVPIGAVYAAAWLYKTALVLAALGVRTRLASGVAAVASVFVWSVAFSFDHTAHHHVVPLVLFTLALAPVATPTLADYAAALREKRPFIEVARYPSWLRYAVMFPVVTAYFQAGVEKLLRSGPLWVNGTTLAGHLLRQGNELGQQLAEAPLVVLALASAGALVWELAFGLVLFCPRLRLPGAVSAFLFHRVLAAAMGLAFHHLVAALLFLYTPYELVAWLGGRGRRSGVSEGAVSERAPGPAAGERAAPTPDPALGPGPGRLGGRFLLAVAFAVAQWVPTGVRGGVYPFLAYDMFNGFYRGGEPTLRAAQLYVEDERGAHAIDPEAALGLNAQHVSEQIFIHFVSEHPRHAALAAGRDAYCRQLLARAAQAEPGARALRIEGDTVRAGEPGSRARRVLATCTR